MQTDREYIEQLTRYEIAGTINPEEQKVLGDAIATDVEAQEIYSSIISNMPPNRLAYISDEMTTDFEARFAATKRKEKNKKIAKIVTLAVSSAAAAVLLAVLITPGTYTGADNAGIFVQHKEHKESDIELKIGSAPAINLSKQQGTIQAGSVTLNNNNRQLSLLNASGNAGIATLTVPNGKEYMLQLPDGSSVQLNAATTLQFPLAFTGNTREIMIAGEAYIIVKKDAVRPFLVNLPHGKVQVLGTEFNINTYDQQEDKIALVSGSIKVKTAYDSSLIKPGYEATVANGANLAVDEFDPYDVLSWRKGEYPFTNASLKTVATLIERYYGIPVQFEGESTSQKFTGVISRKTSVNNFLSGLKLTGFVKEYSFDKDGVLHVR